MVDNNNENLEKNKEDKKVIEAEVLMAEEQIAEEREFIQKQEIETEGKVFHFIKVILGGVIDQILALGLGLSLFGISSIVLKLLGFRIVDDMREPFFLMMYVISNVVYYPLIAEALHGKTLGKKLVFR